MDRKIIAFHGKLKSGKSTAAKLFIEKGYVRHFFAKTLKDMVRCLGLTEEHINGSLKEEPTDLLMGKSPRWAMQSIGTQWGRDLIHPDIWVNAFKNTMPKDVNIVCDDLRFPNEYSMIKSLGGMVVKIERPDLESKSTHESEIHELPYDYLIENAGTIEEFEEKVKSFIDACERKGNMLAS